MFQKLRHCPPLGYQGPWWLHFGSVIPSVNVDIVSFFYRHGLRAASSMPFHVPKQKGARSAFVRRSFEFRFRVPFLLSCRCSPYTSFDGRLLFLSPSSYSWSYTKYPYRLFSSQALSIPTRKGASVVKKNLNATAHRQPLELYPWYSEGFKYRLDQMRETLNAWTKLSYSGESEKVGFREGVPEFHCCKDKTGPHRWSIPTQKYKFLKLGSKTHSHAHYLGLSRGCPRSCRCRQVRCSKGWEVVVESENVALNGWNYLYSYVVYSLTFFFPGAPHERNSV